LGREEVVEGVGLEEDLDTAGLEDTSDGGEQEEEEEEHGEGAGLYDKGVGVAGLLQDPHPHIDLEVTTSFALL
jgi:hypothetical protein